MNSVKDIVHFHDTTATWFRPSTVDEVVDLLLGPNESLILGGGHSYPWQEIREHRQAACACLVSCSTDITPASRKDHDHFLRLISLHGVPV